MFKTIRKNFIRNSNQRDSGNLLDRFIFVAREAIARVKRFIDSLRHRVVTATPVRKVYLTGYGVQVVSHFSYTPIITAIVKNIAAWYTVKFIVGLGITYVGVLPTLIGLGVMCFAPIPDSLQFAFRLYAVCLIAIIILAIIAV